MSRRRRRLFWLGSGVQLESLATTYTTMASFGDSIVVGNNASPVTLGWAYLFASSKSATLTNQGIGGTWWSNQEDAALAPTANNGRDRFVADLLGTNKKEFVAINYGYNEARYVLTPITANVTGFTNDARETLNGLRLGGYSANRILLGNLYTVSDARLANSGATRVGYEQYVTAINNLALEYGVFLADHYGYMNSHGGDSLIDTDTIHPTNAGHVVIRDATLLAQRNTTNLVTNLRSTSPASTSLKVDFTAVPGATSYDVQATLYGALTFTELATPATNTHTFVGLAAGEYTVRVRAVLGAVTGPWEFLKVPCLVGTTLFVDHDFYGITDGTDITTVFGWIRQPVLAAPSSDAVVTGNRLRATSANASVYQRTEVPATADYEVTVWIDARNKSTTGQVGPAGRMSASADTYYYARYTEGATPTYSLFKRVAGVATQLGSNYTATVEFGAIAKLTLSMVGTTIRMLVNDVERANVVDAAIAATGKAGVRLAGVTAAETGAQIDKVMAKAL